MDDIQFWLYLAFGAIYFITRMFKKKKSQQSEDEDFSDSQNKPKPVSFEDLLKEFTQEENPQETPKYTIEEEVPAQREIVQEEVKAPYEEGRTRRFSDDESRKIYEESIKRAEGADLAFERDVHFKSKTALEEESEENHEIAQDIREMLNDPDEAKRAVILGEIFNRKY